MSHLWKTWKTAAVLRGGRCNTKSAKGVLQDCSIGAYINPSSNPIVESTTNTQEEENHSRTFSSRSSVRKIRRSARYYSRSMPGDRCLIWKSTKKTKGTKKAIRAAA
jgi:hypothetical protein